MIEAFKGDEIVKKVGGRFRLTALIQRRMKELIEGARPLVESRGKVLLEIVVQEIMEDKIAIDYSRTKTLKPPDPAELAQEIHGKGMTAEDIL
jgi:DNA-directed RNA polymerase subunit omega